jgi:hypothetical protein
VRELRHAIATVTVQVKGGEFRRAAELPVLQQQLAEAEQVCA